MEIDMANRDDKNNIKDERIEDNTMYGEDVPSHFQWSTPDVQRKIARHLEETTSELCPGNVKIPGKKKARPLD
jgi:hypothetical protein